MKNKNPSPGSINPLYPDARTNIGMMRASAAYSAPIQSTLPNNLRQVSQQKSGQESQREHPFVQLIMQQQQQRNSVSTGGVRRSNNGATTQFKTPASIFPAQPRQQQQQPQQPAQQPQQPRQQQQQQPAQQPQQSAQQQQQLQTLQSDAQSLTETVQLLEEKISILEVFAADQVRELGRLRDELEISSIGTLRVRILDGGSEVYSDGAFSPESPWKLWRPEPCLRFPIRSRRTRRESGLRSRSLSSPTVDSCLLAATFCLPSVHSLKYSILKFP